MNNNLCPLSCTLCDHEQVENLRCGFEFLNPVIWFSGQEMALCQMSSLSEGVLPLTERTWQQLAIREFCLNYFNYLFCGLKVISNRTMHTF